MALVIQNGSLLRAGNALASGSGCCCGNASPYSACGNLCAFRVLVNDIDSEMAACGDELPEGWELQSRVDCDGTRGSYWAVPWLSATKSASGEECESYEGIIDVEFNPKQCSDFERAGIVFVPNLIGYLIGGSRGFSRSGFTGSFPDARSYKSFSMNYDIGIYCAPSQSTPEPCSVCNGALTSSLNGYYVSAALWISAQETRYEGNQFVGTASKLFVGFMGLYIASESEDLGSEFVTQTCEQMNSFTRLSQYDCEEIPLEGCRPVYDFFPDSPLEITLSVDDGVSVAGQTFPWDTEVNDEYNDFEFDFPGDLKEPGGITVYRASRCCCGEESGYCDEEPLP